MQNPCQVCISALLTVLSHTHTYSLSSLCCLQPGQASLSELHQPFMSSRGHSWAPDGGPLPEVPSEAPVIACGVSGGLRPSPFFPETAPTGRRENSGGWPELWTLGLGLSHTARASAAHPCVSPCSGVRVCGLLCDHLCDSVVCVMYVCADVITCASELPPSST